MSDNTEGLRWLVEEREKWKARAEWAEAELVRRDAELSPLNQPSERAQIQVPRDAVRSVGVEILTTDMRLRTQREVSERMALSLGAGIIKEGVASALRAPARDAIQIRVMALVPSEAVLRFDELGRWVR